MNSLQGLRWCWTLVAFGLLLGAGCKRAGTYGPAATPQRKAGKDPSAEKDKDQPAPQKKKKKQPAPPSPDFAWMEPTAQGRKGMEPEVPIKFIHEGTDPDGWKQLKQFWTLVPKRTFPLRRPRAEVRIQVPLGLDDPTPYIPPSNRPTAGKWALGKQLFFDDSYLYPDSVDKRSCAFCHRPDKGFTFGKYRGPDQFRPATLINSVYNTYLFWDGRVSSLEEVVQRSLKDEREPPQKEARQLCRDAEQRHVWLGVVHRLRDEEGYRKRFKQVFGTLPTEDNVGKALATYLRTILAGDSLYDRARKGAGGKVPGASHYLKLLDKANLKALQGESSAKKDEVVKDLVAGYGVFRDQGRCSKCHSGANFTDNDFHNIGVSESRGKIEPGKELGRFARLPLGLKDRRYIGAFKTPTLRALPQTAPYFHDGSGGAGRKDPLLHALLFHHVNPSPRNTHLDPELRGLSLPESDARTLAVFLRALDGKVAQVVSDPQEQPEGVAPAEEP